MLLAPLCPGFPGIHAFQARDKEDVGMAGTSSAKTRFALCPAMTTSKLLRSPDGSLRCERRLGLLGDRLERGGLVDREIR